MIDYYILGGVLDQIKMIIVIEKLDDTEILIDSDNRFTDEVSLKNVMILISFVIKDADKFFHNYFQKKY